MATASPPRRLNRLKAFFLCSKDSEELSMPEKPALQSRQAPVARVQPASLPTLPNQNGAKDKTQFAPDSSKASPGDSSNAALEKAIKDHIQTLSESDRLAFTNASTIDVDVLLESVRKANHEHVQASSFRPYTTKVTNFLNVLQLSVGAASTIAQSEPVSSIALGGAKLVISLAVRYLEYFDKLVNMLDQLSKYLPPLARYSEKCHLPNICDALANVYADILNFYSAARRVFIDDANRSKEFASLKAFFKSQWKPFEAEFGEIKSSLEYHNNVLLHSGVSEILVNSSKEKEEFLRWLSTSNFELRKSKSLEARHVGTCDWLFSTFEFKKWLSSNTSELMWCHGKPGSGKSILASQVVQHLQRTCLDGSTKIYFAYFTVSNTSFNDSRDLILALFNQIFQSQERLPAWLLKAKRENRDPLDYATTENFTKTNASNQRCFIMIDGLDECPDVGRKSVLEFINTLRHARPVFKVFATSRKKTDIAKCFDKKGVWQVTTDSENTTDDINRLIREETASLRQDGTLCIRDDALFDCVVSTLIRKADGMFLWVTLQLDYLCKLETDTDIRDALEDMPSGLTNTYVRILKEIDRQEPLQKAFAIACFRWVLSANRELRWVELELVLPLARLHRPKSFRDCLDGPLITALASACGNLVHIPKNQTNWWWGDEKITFIHSSVFQFFSVNLSSLGFAGDPWNVLSDRNAMHRKNASDCLTFISLLIEDLDYSRDLGKQVEYTAFAYYAFHNFDKHVIASSEQSTACSSMLDSVQKMLARDEVFLETFLRLRLILQPDVAKGVVESRCPENLVTPVISDHILWTTQLYKIPGISQPPRPPGETLRLLSKGGLYEATKNLLNEEAFTSGACSIDEEDQSGSSAIDYASEYGQTSIVDLLLHEGASPEPTPVRQNGSLRVYFGKRTPLFVAVAEGHHAVVKILLRAGVDAKAPVRLYGSLRSPLELATSQGDQLIADLLVRHGAGTQSFESGDAVGGAERD